MQITQSTPTVIEELWASIEPSVEQSESLELAAQAFASAIHLKFQDSVILACVFFTVPFLSLPQINARFVQRLAEFAGRDQC